MAVVTRNLLVPSHLKDLLEFSWVVEIGPLRKAHLTHSWLSVWEFGCERGILGVERVDLVLNFQSTTVYELLSVSCQAGLG